MEAPRDIQVGHVYTIQSVHVYYEVNVQILEYLEYDLINKSAAPTFHTALSWNLSWFLCDIIFAKQSCTPEKVSPSIANPGVLL